MSQNMFEKPFHTAIIITILFVVLITVFKIVGNASNYREARLLKQEKREIKAEIARLKSTQLEAPRQTKRIEMVLNPGERSPKIQTYGDRFSYRFYGTMKVHLYRSEHVYETLFARNGSYELSISQNVVRELQSIVFERPAQCDGPLAFIIDVVDL